MTTPSPSTQTPAIHSFQMDGSTAANPANSVNLFRGDVNLTQTLLTLPGRSQGDGLELSVSIQYQSNVARAAQTWNAEAPTGALGLGWSMALPHIAALPGTSPVAATRNYALYDNGVANQLIRQPLVPVLLDMDAALAPELVDGQLVPASVRAVVLGHGLALSREARVLGAGPWTLVDDDNQQQFELQTTGGNLELRDGGELYQLQNYKFAKILYYPQYERWLVVGSRGIRRSFGGRTADHPRFATAAGNSIAWTVWATKAGGRPISISAGDDVGAQCQVATAWYLAGASDRFGNTIQCRYNDWSRDSNGIIPVVEQQVGVGGLPYTKAVYLSELVDVLGRKVRFNYADKLWSAEPEAAREYADPHRATPSNAPNAYQDRYETRYLDSIEVSSPAGAPMFSFEFGYSLANVTTTTGSLRGDTTKRLLSSIVQRNADGVAQPGLRFDYDLAPDTLEGQPGALLAMTSTQGSVTRYEYTQHSLDITDRRAVIERPSGLAQGASPRVFFGTDYAVVTYYEPNSGKLSMQVYTWVGSWLSWQLDPNDAVLDSGGLALDSLEVLAGADFIALTFARLGGQRAVYVVQRDTARPGQWQAATIDGITTARDVATLSYAAHASFTGGASFFVVAQMDDDRGSYAYDVLTWRWTDRRWIRTHTPTASYAWIAAGNEYFAVLDSTGALTLEVLDGRLEWTRAASTTIANLRTFDHDAIRLVPGGALVVVANLHSSNQQLNEYTLTIAEWDDQYAISLNEFDPFTDVFGDQSQALDWTPRIVADTLIAANGNLLRRTGGGWSVNTDLNLGNPPGRSVQRYAYGTDYAIRVINDRNGNAAPTAVLVAYDPTQAQPWTAPTPIAQSLAEPAWPSAAGPDWAAIGPFVYSRGTATNWADVVTNTALADLREVAGKPRFLSESLVNEGPEFLAYTVANDQGGRSAQAVVLRNGSLVAAPTELLDEQLYVASDGGVPGMGVGPEGPSAFVSFPASAARFDSAQTIMLHRYAGDAIAGPITHYTVTLAELDDGIAAPVATTFEPELSSASCDPSGEIVKFYEVAVYPGARSSSAATQGKVVSRFYNGLAARTEDNDYDMLDGMLIETQTYAQGQVDWVERTTTSWKVVQQIASSPTNPDAPAIMLRGGWVMQTSQQEQRDGVTTTTDTGYVAPGLRLPYCGQPTLQSRAQYDATGEHELFQRTTTYAAQVNAAVLAIHALADVAQVTDVRIAGGQTTLLSSTVMTCASWATAIDPELRAPAPEAQFGLLSAPTANFPFAEYRSGDTPAGWRLSTRTTARARYGQELEAVDGRGVATTTVFDANAELPVAVLGNATQTGCAYLGFQAYEDSSRWTLEGVDFDAALAFAGARSARLPGKLGASVSVSVSVPGTAAQTYMVGYRYRTPAGVGVGEQAGGVEARVTVDGLAAPTITRAWTATEADWIYASLAIPIPEGRERSVVVEARNAGATDLHIDSILVAPLPSGANIQTYDPVSLQFLASMDAGGRTTRTAYDRNQQPAVTVGVAGLVRELSLSFASRAGNGDDRFDPRSPNAALTLDAATGGVLERFRDGGGWAKRWAASDPEAWVASDGALDHRSANPGSIVWQGDPGDDSYALYFELDDPSASPSVTAGDVCIAWTHAGYRGSQAGVDWTALAQPPSLAQHWLLVVGDGVVLFFADGQLLFSEKTRPASASLAITAGAISLRNLTVLGQVRLGLGYLDGAGRQRQVHQLHGADSYLRELVYDDLGRQLATSKSAPGSFGAGAKVPVMGFRPSFVDISAFLAATRSSWVMTGDVADYYAGQTDDGVARSNDEGYPYWGTRYEASPRTRRVEAGQPGKRYAINLEVEPDERPTLLLEFGGNSPEPGAKQGNDLPAGVFHEDQLTSTSKAVGTRVSDLFGQTIAASWRDASGSSVCEVEGLRRYTSPATGPSATLEVRLPNALVSGPQAGDEGYTRTAVANALQETVCVGDSDTGETRFVTDSAGNLRFVQPALDEGEAWMIYSKYDALGRVIEQGSVEGQWTASELAALADQPSFPSGGQATVVTRYDGEGDQPELIGMKWQTTTTNRAPDQAADAGDCRVVETFAYDQGGNIEAVTQTLSGAVTAAATIRYGYNALGEVVRIDLPEGAPIGMIAYTHDDQGLVVQVGTSPGAADLGHFDYDPDGQVLRQTYAGDKWRRCYAYASPGWVTGLDTRSADGSQRLGMDMAYDADAMMRSRAVEFGFAEPSSYADQFSYDGLRRLAAAEGSSAVSYPRYDANGNPWTIIEAGASSVFECEAGTNRLRSVTLADAEPALLRYDARGQLREGLGRSFAYERSTAMTTAITRGPNCIRLGYGGAQQRVLKQIVAGGGESRVYFTGAGLVPVATLVGDRWTVNVQGPTGLLAYVSDQTYLPLTDPTGSVWAVVDANGLVGTSSYRPFGGLAQTTGSPERIPYRFQGQEWDAEVGLYNFRARIYDPVLRRFLSPDPRRQFASPYVFAADAPLTIVDPTGELATWARVGIGVGMAALLVAGLVLTAGAADAGLLMFDGMVVAGVSVEAGEATGTAVAAGVLGSTLTGAAGAGFGYDLSHGQDFTAGGLFKNMGIGAAAGAVSGAIGGALGPLADAATTGLADGTASALQTAAGRAVSGAIAYSITLDLQQVLTNVVTAQPWYQGLLRSTIVGATEGGGMSAAGSLAGSAWQELSPLMRDPAESWAAFTDSLSGRYGTVLVRNASTIQAAFAAANPNFVVPGSLRM